MAQYVQTTTFANGNTADGGQVNTEIVALGNAVNNVDATQLDIPTNAVVSARQGGSSTDWNTTGTSTQTVTNPVIQTGVGTTGSQSFSSPNYFSTLNITFPTAYTNKPIVIPWLANVGGTMAFGATVSSVTTSGCTITVNSGTDGYVANSVVGWIAIGS